MRSTGRRLLASSIVFSTIAFGAAGQPRPAAVGDQPSFLDQSWSEDDRSWFYTITQGSQLMPYYWFLALERPGSNKLFLDDQLARFGYLPPYQTQRYSTRNPDDLPIGFVRDDARERGPWIGMTCAACHTNQVRFPSRAAPGGKALLQIDGAPSGANFFDFIQELSQALEATVSSPEKFERFAAAVARITPKPTSVHDAAARAGMQRSANAMQTVTKPALTWPGCSGSSSDLPMAFRSISAPAGRTSHGGRPGSTPSARFSTGRLPST